MFASISLYEITKKNLIWKPIERFLIGAEHDMQSPPGLHIFVLWKYKGYQDSVIDGIILNVSLHQASLNFGQLSRPNHSAAQVSLSLMAPSPGRSFSWVTTQPLPLSSWEGRGREVQEVYPTFFVESFYLVLRWVYNHTIWSRGNGLVHVHSMSAV